MTISLPTRWSLVPPSGTLDLMALSKSSNVDHVVNFSCVIVDLHEKQKKSAEKHLSIKIHYGLFSCIVLSYYIYIMDIRIDEEMDKCFND